MCVGKETYICACVCTHVYVSRHLHTHLHVDGLKQRISQTNILDHSRKKRLQHE